jgi:hypothetical protein
LAFEVFIVYFKCSTKKGVGRIRNDAFTGSEKLSTRPEGGLYKFLSELASAFSAQRLFLWCARQGTLTWSCRFSMGPTAGTISRTARVSVVRLNLKEAAGKALARRTGIAYEAVMSDKKAIIFKVQ